MSYRFRVAGAVCLAGAMMLGSMAGVEAKVTYTCTLKPAQSKTWIPEVLFIGHDEAKGRVVVSDPIVLYFNDRVPVEGRVIKNTRGRITFAWDYFAKDPRGQRAKMMFRATWSDATRKMKVTATPAGHSKRFRGSGSCERDIL